MRDSEQERWDVLSLPLVSSLTQAGLTLLEIEESLSPLKSALQSSTGNGVKLFATSVKSWQKVARNILARESPTRDDDVRILASRLACRCKHKMKRLGLTELEITDVVSTQGRRRIPPFFWTKSLVKCLFSTPSFEDVSRATPVACIGRTAPIGDVSVIHAALEGFVSNVGRKEAVKFDFARVTETLLRTLGCRIPLVSYWEAKGRGSRKYPRAHGGKRGEVQDEIYLEFMHLPLYTILPERPTGDVMDILGNVACYAKNWDGDQPIGRILYAESGNTRDIEIDDRFGMIGLIWSLTELRKLDTLQWEVNEDWPFFAVERTPVISKVTGSVKARVTAQPEEGWKVRIITLTDFSVSLIGSTCRHLLDPVLLSADPQIKIGLRSKVKLYDSLVFLNGMKHMGISTMKENNLHYRHGTSADLQTATDTPGRSTIGSIFQGWMAIIPDDHPCRNLLVLGICLATLDRDFEMPSGYSSPEHCCGIMMGEGLSGIFLNTASLIVRAVVEEMATAFPEIYSLGIDEVDDFVMERSVDLQAFLDNFKSITGLNSSQSGDDLYLLSHEPRSPFLRVLYRMMGFQPSNTTWFESSQYVTFCEEHAVRTYDSNGWTFVDTVKPRLFNIESPDPEVVTSRIRQISNTLGYRKDTSLIRKLIPLVNRMLELCPEVSNTLSRYKVPAGLPSWLGGIDHPEGLLPEFELDDLTKKILHYLDSAPFEVLVEEYLVKSFDSFAEQNMHLLTKTSSFILLPEVNSLSELDHASYISRNNLPIPEREQGEKYGDYTQRVEGWISNSGLVSVKKLLDDITSADSVRNMYKDPSWEPGKVSVRRRIKDRRKHLRSLIPEDFECDMSSHITPWSVKCGMDRKLEHRLVSREFLLEHGLINLPSLQVRGFRR